MQHLNAGWNLKQLRDAHAHAHLNSRPVIYCFEHFEGYLGFHNVQNQFFSLVFNGYFNASPFEGQ